MAIFKEGITGKFSGRIGNLVGRIRYGTTIVGIKPGSVKDANSAKQQTVRAKFSIVTLFIQSALNLESIKSIWKKYAPLGWSPANLMMNKNYKLSSQTAITTDNILTPSQGLSFSLSEVKIEDQSLVASVPALSTFFPIPPDAVSVEFCAVFSFTNPNTEGKPAYVPAEFSKLIENFNFNSAYSLDVPLPAHILTLAGNYQRTLIHISAVILTSGLEITAFTDSFSSEL